MPDSKISALPSATVPLAGTEVLPIVQSSVTDKVTAADLLRQNGQTVTTSNPVLSLAQTWNAGGVTFTGLKFNATDTASAAASLLLDLQTGGTSQFKVSKAGDVTAVAGYAAGVKALLDIGQPGLSLSSESVVAWSSTTSYFNTKDTILNRDAANTLALRNSTTAQTFRVYNTYTDASNYERALSGWGGGVYYIGTEKLGTGSTRAMSILIGGTTAWSFDTSRNFVAGADNTYDIGASGATRPRTIYAGTQFIGPDGSDASPSFTFGASQTGMYRDSGGGRIRFAVGGTFGVSIASGGIGLASDTAFIQMGQSSDVVLNRDAANTLAQRNGVNAQNFRVYNTYTDSSNYERGSFAWSGNSLFITSERAGTGTARDMVIRAANGLNLSGDASSNSRWQINTSGHFLASTDNVYDIGASGATRPRTGYFGTSVLIGGVAPAGASGLATVQAFGAAYALIGGDGLTDATTKNTRIGGLHYTAAEKPVAMMIASAGSSSNTLSVGGGTSSANAATQINFFTGATNTTPTGTARLQIDSAGHLLPGADATYKLGDNAAQFIDAYISRSVLISQAAIPAGGAAGRGVRFSSATNFGVFFGSGAPTLSAAQGSLYLRSDGSSTSTRMYVNTDGSTTWTAVTTAA